MLICFDKMEIISTLVCFSMCAYEQFLSFFNTFYVIYYFNLLESNSQNSILKYFFFFFNKG